MDTDGARRANRFFDYVWRFNALAIAVAAILCILLGVYAGAIIFKQETRSRRVTNVVNVGDKDKIAEEFTLGDPSTIAGTQYVRVPLYRGQSYGASSAPYYSKISEQNLVNFLFLNSSTNESRWLFENAGQLLISSQVLSNKLKTTPGEQNAAVAILYTVVERDSNGDNRLTDKDAVSLAASDVDGTKYRKLIEGIERLYSVQQIADDKVLVLYLKDQKTLSELYSLPTMVRLQQSSIAKINLH
jgi:hypothetical protein